MLHHSQLFDTAKKGRGLSSLLISKVGKESKGKKKRKLNDGEVEEAKESESEEEEQNDEMADEVSQNQQQYINQRIPPVPKVSKSKYGSRKKRPFGQFQQEQSAAVNELSEGDSVSNLHTPKTVRNSAQKFRKTNTNIQEGSPDKEDF